MNGSIGESIMRAAIQEYLGPMVPIIKTRALPWLKGLELDCYCPDLRFAFEYQGIQHYERVPLFQPGEGDFKAQQDRDARKRLATTKAFVALIEIPYTVPRNMIRDRVRRELFFLGFDPVAEPIPYADFIRQVMETETRAVAMLAQAREIAISHGGECLSTVYVDCRDSLEFRCKLGHPFTTPLTNVNHVTHTRPRFCPECGGTRLRTFEENKADLDSVGYTLLSQRAVMVGIQYPKATTELTIVCPVGHRYTILRTNILPLIDGKPQSECCSCARHRTGQAFGHPQRDARCATLGIERVGPYRGRFDDAEWRCLKCTKQFTVSWNSLILRKNGACQSCKRKKS